MSTFKPTPDRFETPKTLRSGLDRVVRSLGLPSTDSFELLFSRWTEVVGPELAGRCSPASLRNGRLVIKAADHAWATELRWLEKELISRCDSTLGAGVVTTISIRT